MPYLSDGATWVPDANLGGYSATRPWSAPMTNSGSSGGFGQIGMSWSPAPGTAGDYPAGNTVNGVLQPGSGAGATGSATGSASGSMSIPASNIPAPDMQSFQYTQNQQNYPWYMRGLGENMSQQAYQTAVNQGARLGASVQGVMGAQNLQNQQRLGYMSQAGQQDLQVGQAMATEIQRRNDEALRKYQLELMSRGQDLSYQAQMAAINARSQGASAGGQLRSGGSGGGGRVGGTGQGTYTDIFGNVSIGSTPIKYGASDNNPYANPFATGTGQQGASGPMAGGYGTGATNTASQGWQPYASGSNPSDPYNVMQMGIY